MGQTSSEARKGSVKLHPSGVFPILVSIFDPNYQVGTATFHSHHSMKMNGLQAFRGVRYARRDFGLQRAHPRPERAHPGLEGGLSKIKWANNFFIFRRSNAAMGLFMADFLFVARDLASPPDQDRRFR